MVDSMAEVNASLEAVKAKMLTNGDKLDAKHRAAFESVLERSEASNMVRQATLERDRTMLSEFWALHKDQRTPEAWNEFWVNRDELWDSYRLESAIPSAGEFVTRRRLSELYHGLPEPKL